MENQPVNQPNNSPNSGTIPNKSKNKLAIYAIVGIILASAVIGGLLYYSTLSSPQTNANEELFTGAFVSYYGESNINNNLFGMQIRQEIVDFNRTHIKTLTYSKINSNTLATPYEDQYTNWTLRTGSSDAMEDMMLLNKYSDQIYFPNLGTKDCMIYEYQYKAGSEQIGTVTMYLNQDIGLPYKFIYNLLINGVNVVFDMSIEDTNIPAMKS